MAWTAIYMTATGQLISVGTVVADPLPETMTALVLAQQPTAVDVWDVSARQFVARVAETPADRLLDVLTDSAYAADLQAVWAILSGAQRTLLRNGLNRLLARFRYRAASEPLSLEP